MIYSLSEIDATCKKAARGAGLSWGYAEEAGKAARWLAAHQLPGTALLAAYLTERQTHPEYFQGSNPKCPLLAGAGLCDGGFEEMKKSITLGSVVYPLLLLPYVAQLSNAVGLGLRIQWQGADIACSDGQLYINENCSIVTSEVTQVSCHYLAAGAGLDELSIQNRGAVGQSVEAEHWVSLETLAHLTYVPATEASRKGAGPTD